MKLVMCLPFTTSVHVTFPIFTTRVTTKGHLVFIQVKHPADGADVQRWEHTLRLCESRIAKRGEGHRTLKGQNPKLRTILQRTRGGIQT